MMKKKSLTSSSALGLAAILVLSIVALAGTFVNPHPASATASISTSKALPSIHLINGKGQFIDMGLMSYKDGVTGKAVVKLPDNFYLKHRPASGFALTMEDVVKFRADQGTTFKVIAKTAGAYNKGIEPGLRYGSNDDWDHFLTVKETSDFRGAYKVTYVLNQHNPCFSEESFQFAAGSIHAIQVYAGVIFADGSRAIYGASVNVIGTNASDNPTTGCDSAPSGWLGGSGGSIFASSSSNTVIIENHVTVKSGSDGSSSSHHSNNNEHHDSHHDGGGSYDEHHHDYSHDNQNDNKHARYDKDGNPVFLPGNKDPHENQSEPDDHGSGYTGGGSYTSDTSSSDSHQQQQEQSNNNDKPSSDHTHEQGQQHQQHNSEEHSNNDNSNNNDSQR